MTMISTFTAIALPAFIITTSTYSPSANVEQPLNPVGPEVATGKADNTDKARLIVTLAGVEEKAGPMYVAVQKRENYQKWNAGVGGVYKDLKAGDHTYEYILPAGEYAISVWHDSDNDGKFTMQGYTPLDGWGNSGMQELQGPPTFDDVKITVPAQGTTETVKLHYPAQ
jgi:uncharacterized protein (DUF2141 family)